MTLETVRTETVTAFAACVYLMFSSVYVCKEAVQHLLLGLGAGAVEGAEGHHHHRGDEVPLTLGLSPYSIEFPTLLVFITLLSLLITALYFNNHSKLVHTTATHLPPLRTLFSRHPSPPAARHSPTRSY